MILVVFCPNLRTTNFQGLIIKEAIFDPIALLCCVQSVTRLCPILCDPLVCSLSGSSIHRIFQARIRVIFWIRVPFSPPEDLLNPGIELPPLVPPNSFTAPSGKPCGFIKHKLPTLNDSEDALRHCTGFGVNITL